MNAPPQNSLGRDALADARDAITGNHYLRLLRHRWGRAVAALVAIAAALVGLSGGFEQMPSRQRFATMKPHNAGQSIDAGQFTVAPQAAWVTHKSSPDSQYPDPASSQLVVELTVTSQDRNPVAFRELQKDMAWLQQTDAAGGYKPRTDLNMERPGKLFLQNLQPGVPTRIVATWKLSGQDAASPPKTMRLAVIGRAYHPASGIFQQPAWKDAGPAGLWSIPVSDRRAAELATHPEDAR